MNFHSKSEWNSCFAGTAGEGMKKQLAVPEVNIMEIQFFNQLEEIITPPLSLVEKICPKCYTYGVCHSAQKPYMQLVSHFLRTRLHILLDRDTRVSA